MPNDPEDIVDHYETSFLEENRISGGFAELELVRTQEILRRHLPPPPARIPRHIEVALRELGDLGLTAEVGDARDLHQPDRSADVVLLLGPLYHLVEEADRLRALAEARRVVRSQGLVAVAAISRFASLFDSLARGHLFEPEFHHIVDRDPSDGRHGNPDRRPGWFTTAFYHHPDELRAEIGKSGLSLIELVGVEGLAGRLPQLGARWAEASGRAIILKATRWIESEPALAALSGHLLAVARV